MTKVMETKAQLKRLMQEGTEYKVVENAIKPRNNGQVRTISMVQGNGVQAYENERPESFHKLLWQKSSTMRFNIDGTVDFLLGDEMKEEWLIKQQEAEGKDYWLKIVPIRNLEK